MLKALTSVTDDGSQLMQTSLPPRKGGRHSCVVGNPVQCEVLSTIKKAVKQPVNRERSIVDLPLSEE